MASSGGPALPAVSDEHAAEAGGQEGEEAPTKEQLQRRSAVMADAVAAATERNKLVERERHRRRKEERYVKRTLETTVCRMLEVLQTQRGQEILDQEAAEIQKRRFRIVSRIDPEEFLEDTDLRNFVLVKLFQLYDINKSAAISRSDFVGIVQECMGIIVRDSDVDSFFNTGVVADFEAVSEFIKWKLSHQSKKLTRSQLKNVELARDKSARAVAKAAAAGAAAAAAGGGGGSGGGSGGSGGGSSSGGGRAGSKSKLLTPTKEDFRIAQKMILEKLKIDTGKQARVKFRSRHPALLELPEDGGGEGGGNGSHCNGADHQSSGYFGGARASEYERGQSFRRMTEDMASLGSGPDEDDDAEWEASMTEETIMRAEWLLIQQEVKNKKGKLAKVWYKRPVFTQLVGQQLYAVDIGSLKKSFDLHQHGATLQVGTTIVDRGNLDRLVSDARTRDDLNIIITLSPEGENGGGMPGLRRGGGQLFVRAHSIGQKIAWMRALFGALQGDNGGDGDDGGSPDGGTRSRAATGDTSGGDGGGSAAEPAAATPSKSSSKGGVSKTSSAGGPPPAPKVLEALWRDSDQYTMQGVLIKLPTSTKTVDAERLLARAAETENFFAQEQLPRGAEYRFFALRGSVLSYYDFKWAWQSIVPQHGLDDRCMVLGPGCKILVDSVKKSAQASQEDAKISNPEVAAALEKGTTFTISSPPVFLTFASPEKPNGLEWLQVLSRASSAVSAEEASANEKVEMLYQGWFLKKGQNKTDRWRPRFFVYWTSGIVQYFEGGGDNSNEKPLGEINLARDAKEIRWSTDALIQQKDFPSPHCIEIVTNGRVWQLCPIDADSTAGGGGGGGLGIGGKRGAAARQRQDAVQAVHGDHKPARVLTRFMRLLESNLRRHKERFTRQRMSVSGADRQYVPRGLNLSARTGRGMSAWQRISGNVPSSYVSYAEIKLIRLVSDLAINDTAEPDEHLGTPRIGGGGADSDSDSDSDSDVDSDGDEEEAKHSADSGGGGPEAPRRVTGRVDVL